MSDLQAAAVRITGHGGDEIEASRVGGETSGRVDGEEASLPSGLTALLDRQEGDTAILANRFAGPVWVAEIYPL